MAIEQFNVTNRIHLLIFDTQKDVASTFLRFQEHYESPEFMGKIFSLEEFKEWYVQNSPKGKETGEFTYYSDWNGFNIPSSVLRLFYQGKFDPLSEQERKFLERFKDEPEPFYVIGVHKSTKKLKASLQHEVAHGLFFTDEHYRNEVLRLLTQFDTEPIREELRSKAGYHEQVLDDEVHAYSINTGRKLKTPIPQELVTKLRTLYEEHLRLNDARFPPLK
jgi:hypothetical protein